MTGPENYAEAERLLEETGQEFQVDESELPVFMAQVQSMIARAQVHATLALAAATALNDAEKGMTVSDWNDWLNTCGTEVTP